MPMQAVPASLTLVSDTDTIVLRPPAPHVSDPVVCSNWDLTAPAVRDSVVDRPGGDGTIDRTLFTGSRTATFDLHVFGDVNASPYAYVERLAAMTHPSARPRLRARRDTPENLGVEWEMELRGNPYSLAYGRQAAAKLDVQLSFVAPLGYFQQTDWRGVQTGQVSGVETGWTLPLTLPFSTGGGLGVNTIVSMFVGGSVPITPTIYIYGPVANPEIRDETGQRFKFAGLTLDSGQFVQVDMGAATVRVGGSADASVYYLVDFSVSTFWTWRPGEHSVRNLSTGGSVAVQWRDRRYSI